MWGLLFTIIGMLPGGGNLVSPQETVIMFAGDAMQHQAQLDKAKEIGRDHYNYSECFELIAPAIQKAHYSVCNLEVPLGGPPDYSGYPCFSAPDSFAEALKDAGFDLFLTANNHILDRRDKAARRTLDVLDSLKIDHVGSFRNSEERELKSPFIKEINGYKIAFLNYTYGTNGIKPTDGVEIAYINKDKISEEIEEAKRKGAEIIIVAMHWGIEYVLIQNNIQEDLASFLVDNGVDMIIGGHPHVVQPMKVVRNEKENKDVLMVYSLGNFISNMKTADTRGGAILFATLSRDSIGKAKFKNAEYELIFSAKPEGKGNFKVIPGWLEDSIPSSQKYHWDIFKRGALKVLDKNNINVPRLSSNL
ncbi:MAG: CapA family protein [Muribaculaceae bacterium]|nr:CapA family protein [Muribaculaceae bacterium]